jgi:type IV pilus assembly protein PilA
MRASIKNYMDALEKQRIERGEDGGFSLIELIVVVVILGILAAIAIPIFLNIQDQARKSSLEAIAANGATQVAAALAQDPAKYAVGSALANLAADENNDGTNDVTVAVTKYTSPNIDTICVTATRGTTTATSGPGC